MATPGETPGATADGASTKGWLLLRNEAAGSDDAELVERVARGLEFHAPAEVVATADTDELDAALRSADGRVVVVCGGDGSVQLAVERARTLGLLDDLVFGVVPLGTGNDLAGNLGLPDHPAEAVAHLVQATPTAIDLLVTEDDRVVVNAVHVGIGVRAAERSTDLKASFGKLAYPLGALTAGVAAEGLALQVELDGTRIDLDQPSLMVVVSNGCTIGGGHAVVPHAEVDDGRLDVVVVHAVDPGPRVAFATALLRGTHLDRDDVVVGSGREVRISGDDLAHNRDGELEETSSEARTYRVEPGAWKLLR